MLPIALVMTVFFSGFSMHGWRIPVGSNDMKSALHQAVLRFDTRIVFSCEEFAREMSGRPLVHMNLPIVGLWERIKADSRARRSSAHASPECLVQAGLLVV